MQRDTTLQDILSNAPIAYFQHIEDAFTLGVEELFVEIMRASLVKPAHIKHLMMLVDACIDSAKHQVNTNAMRPFKEGVDL